MGKRIFDWASPDSAGGGGFITVAEPGDVGGGGGSATFGGVDLTNVVVPHTATAASPHNIGSPIHVPAGHLLHVFADFEFDATPGSTDLFMLVVAGGHGTPFGFFGPNGGLGTPPFLANGTAFAVSGGDWTQIDDLIVADSDLQLKAWIDNGSGGAGSTDLTLSAIRLLAVDLGALA